MAEVIVKSSSNGKFAQSIEAGDHNMICDIDKELGGEETGPDPHELMLASLGACTSITIKMYAQRKEIPLEGVSIKLTEEKIADPEDQTKSMPRILREITLSGDLSDEQVEMLTKIADKCPIHKLISGKKAIDTEVSKS